MARLGRRRRRHRAGREATRARRRAGNRHRPDGVELRWQQLGVKGLQSDPQLPFFVQWETPSSEHPSQGATGNVALAKIEIAGDPHRVSAWLDTPYEHRIGTFDVEWVAPNGTPGIVAATFADAERLRPDLIADSAVRRNPGVCGRARSRARTSGTTPPRTRSRTARSTPMA